MTNGSARRHGTAACLAAVALVVAGSAGCTSGATGAAPSGSGSTAVPPTAAVSTTAGSTAPTASSTATGSASGTVTGPQPTSTSTTTASTTATAAPTATTPAVPPLAGPLPTSFVAVNKTIKDLSLGHEIHIVQVARALPWPAGPTGSTGSSALASAFELVAVQMRWTPGTKYTAPVRAIDVSLITGSQYPNRPDPLIDAQLAAAGWAMLPAEVPAGQTATGWLVFKVDPVGATSIRLDYTRPAIVVTGTKTSFPKKVYSQQIIG